MIVDVSQFQGIPDFKALKHDGVEAVYIKATEGTTFVSPTLREQWAKAGEAKLIRGTYHFLRQDLHHAGLASTVDLPLGDGYMGCAVTRDWHETVTEGTEATDATNAEALGATDAEAVHFIRTVRALPGRHGHAWHKGDLRPALDFEVGTSDKRFSTPRNRFQGAIHAQTRHGCPLYTFPAFNPLWRTPPRFSPQLWIADFGVRAPKIPAQYREYDLWQFTSNAHIRGVRGPVDLSRLAHGWSIDHLRCQVTG